MRYSVFKELFVAACAWDNDERIWNEAQGQMSQGWAVENCAAVIIEHGRQIARSIPGLSPRLRRLAGAFFGVVGLNDDLHVLMRGRRGRAEGARRRTGGSRCASAAKPPVNFCAHFMA
jgi:hypothetical protein